jgi:hypothetical protein
LPNVDLRLIDWQFLSPQILTAYFAGALSALFLVFLLLALRRSPTGETRPLIPLTMVVMTVLVLVTVLDHMTQDQLAADRRALTSREAQLTTLAFAPGSVLGCLDASVGDQLAGQCEKAIFATPQSLTDTIAYVEARLSLLRDVLSFSRKSDPTFADNFVGLRRAIELDRFGIAAHVLAEREHCTPDNCALFARLQDARTLKTNLSGHVFDDYLTRYAAIWDGKVAGDHSLAFAPPLPTQERTTGANLAKGKTPAKGPRYDYFPSAASIPAVSIMGEEPRRPNEVDAKAAAPSAHPAAAPAHPAAPPAHHAAAPARRPAEPKAEAAPPLQLVPAPPTAQ